MKSKGWLVLVVCALLACKKKPPAPDQYEYRVFVEGRAGVLQGVEMGGKPLEGGKPEARGMSFSLTVPASEHASDRTFTVLVNTTCGTEKLPAKLALGIARAEGASAEDSERAGTRPGQAVLADLEYAAPAVARIHLDTDGAAGVKVEIGATALAMNETEQDVTVGSCPTAKEVKVDGKVEGSVVVETRTVDGASGKKFEVPGTTLIDPTGKHCYEVVTHVYSAKDQDTSNMARSAPKRLEGAKVFAQEIDDFLKESPKEVQSADSYPMRTEIRRCPRKAAKRR